MDDHTASEQDRVDRHIAERLTEIAAELLANGGEATVGLSSLMRHLRDIDPVQFDQIHANITLARLSLREPATAH